jgi:HAD superfamily hydrolase (TIGR01509 family)
LQTAPLNPKALLLDLDGTLADSLGVMRAVYERYVTHFGGAPSEMEFNRLNGPPLKEIVRILKETYTLTPSHDELYALYNQFIDEAYDGVQPNEGGRSLLDLAKTNLCIVGIVTSNSRARTERWLRISELEKFVDFMVTGEDVKKGKPDPEPYLIGVQKAGVPSDLVAGVEDSAQGLQSVIASGIHAYGFNIEAQGAVRVSSLSALSALLW